MRLRRIRRFLGIRPVSDVELPRYEIPSRYQPPAVRAEWWPQMTEQPAWLSRLQGLCTPCSDAEFYGTRIRHASCEHGGCTCTYVIPAEWPPGTWKA